MNKGYIDQLNLFNKICQWLKPEATEQAKLVLYLEEHAYTYTAIPNSTFTKSWKQKALNIVTGLKPGLCDILIVLNRGSLLFIEMKLPKKVLKNGNLGASPSVISDEQKRWIEILDSIDNVSAVVCFGHKDAIDTIEAYETF